MLDSGWYSGFAWVQLAGSTLVLVLGVVVADGSGLVLGSGLGSGDGVSPPVTVRVAGSLTA